VVVLFAAVRRNAGLLPVRVFRARAGLDDRHLGFGGGLTRFRVGRGLVLTVEAVGQVGSLVAAEDQADLGDQVLAVLGRQFGHERLGDLGDVIALPEVGLAAVQQGHRVSFGYGPDAGPVAVARRGPGLAVARG
jgi:hypothetical protein